MHSPKAIPATNGHAQGHYRLRYDRIDTKGKMSIRRAGRMHHLGVGTTHARKRVLAFADDHQVPSPTLLPARSSQPTRSSPTRPTGATKQRARPLAELLKVRPMSQDM